MIGWMTLVKEGVVFFNRGERGIMSTSKGNIDVLYSSNFFPPWRIWIYVSTSEIYSLSMSNTLMSWLVSIGNW